MKVLAGVVISLFVALILLNLSGTICSPAFYKTESVQCE